MADVEIGGVDIPDVGTLDGAETVTVRTTGGTTGKATAAEVAALAKLDTDIATQAELDAHNHDGVYSTFGHSHPLDGLTDVETTGISDGQTIVWDSGTARFVPGEVSASAGFDTVTVTSGAASYIGKRLVGATWIDADTAFDASGDFAANQPDPADFPLWWRQPVTNDQWGVASAWYIAAGADGNNLWRPLG